MFRISLLLALGVLAAAASPAHAQTSNCTAIGSLPATISTPGVYCLKRNLTTGMTSGNAITIAADGVTLDCNDYKVGSLASGATTSAVGIYGASRRFTKIRRCNIRGFRAGINLSGWGALIEDNHINGSTQYGMYASLLQSMVRRNRISATGSATAPSAYGIFLRFSRSTVVSQNVIGDLASTGETVGIVDRGAMDAIVDNRISGLVGGTAVNALQTTFRDSLVRGNHFLAPVNTPYPAVTLTTHGDAVDGDATLCAGNVSIGFLHGAQAMPGCTDGGNTIP